MKKGPKEPPLPSERHETIRREIMHMLQQGMRSAREISSEARIPEKDVYFHLEHIQKTAHKTDRHLHVQPAECLKCGFAFAKREKLKKPGRCPVCRSELIQEPLFTIK